jgi:hypothetical protein
MQRVHSVTLSRNTAKYKAVKKCFDQAGSGRLLHQTASKLKVQ